MKLTLVIIEIVLIIITILFIKYKYKEEPSATLKKEEKAKEKQLKKLVKIDQKLTEKHKTVTSKINAIAGTTLVSHDSRKESMGDLFSKKE